MEYGGWPNCYRLSNGLVDLVATTDVGPRIIRFGFVGGENEFKEFPYTLGLTGGDEWRSYGGHRLWVAPEHPIDTYTPDNSPVRAEVRGTTLHLAQDTDPRTGIAKSIEVSLANDSPRARISHRLRNDSAGSLTAAAWALSVMAPGGTAVVSLPPRGPQPTNLSPTSAIALWPYTDMADQRWRWETNRVTLSQDSAAPTPQKAGFAVPDGWCSYERAGHRFTKGFRYDPGAPYPDFGSSVELYTDGEMLELETLGPPVDLAPGESLEHLEEWELERLPTSDFPRTRVALAPRTST